MIDGLSFNGLSSIFAGPTVAPPSVNTPTVSSAITTVAGESLTATAPSGVQAGDVLVAFGFINPGLPGTPPSLPSGWTSLGTQNSISFTTASFLAKKVATGSDAYNFAWTGATNFGVAIFSTRSTTGTEDSGIVAAKNATSITGNGLTSGGTNRVLLAGIGASSNAAFTSPSGMIPAASSIGASLSLYGSYKLINSAGATQSVVGNWGASVNASEGLALAF